MIAPADMGARQLWTMMWRLRLALWAMRVAGQFGRLAEWLLPEDFRRGSK